MNYVVPQLYSHKNSISIHINIYLYIYVTVNLCNQGLHEIPKHLSKLIAVSVREFTNLLKLTGISCRKSIKKQLVSNFMKSLVLRKT